MPIINSGFKREAFLQNIALHLCGVAKFGEVHEGGEDDRGQPKKTIYFGGGYWRGAWMADEAGVILFNPDNTRAQALVVEEAMCILRCGKFQP